MKKYFDIDLIDFDGVERPFKMCLGTREILAFEDVYQELTGDKKATLFNSMAKIQNGDLKAIIALSVATLHEVNKQGVMKKQTLTFNYFDDNFDLFENLPRIQEGFEVIFKDLKVKEDKEDKAQGK